MVFRAIFWIAVVAVFIPREPDIGYGPPSAGLSSKTVEWLAATFKVPPCEERSRCVAGLSVASDFRQVLRDRLEQAKVNLKASSPPSLALTDSSH